MSTRLGPEVNSPWAGSVQISVEHESEVNEERREEKATQVSGEADKGTSGKVNIYISQEETTRKECRKRKLKILCQVQEQVSVENRTCLDTLNRWILFRHANFILQTF